MICPNCGQAMKWSDFVVDTYPETHEAFCSCGCIVDVCGSKKRLCFRSTLTEEQKERVESILASGKTLEFEPAGEEL